MTAAPMVETTAALKAVASGLDLVALTVASWAEMLAGKKAGSRVGLMDDLKVERWVVVLAY